jgi:uncharacterized protein (DUF4213/DUF364 family)
MRLKERIIEKVEQYGGDKRISDARIGLGYTSITLESGETGLAYTFHHNLKNECTVYSGIRPIAGESVLTIVKMLLSSDPLETAVALATANAVLNNRNTQFINGDILDQLNLTPDDTVSMIGNFRPLVSSLRERGQSLRVFEREENLADNILPAEEAFGYLAKSSIAIITSTTVINSTIEALLESARHCREVIMLGASTTLCPELFKETPITALSGVIVKDGARISQIVSEGGGMKRFKGEVQKVTLRV